MRSTTKRLGAAAVASMFAVASAGGAALAVPESGGAGNSSATIAVEDCVLESSKEISYVEYLTDGTAVTKDESVDAESLDLTTVEGIEDFDAVEVKAGTTAETFAIECAADDGTAGTAGGETDETETQGDETETQGDETEGEEAGHADDGAVITLSGCTVESSKDISYIEYRSEDGSSTKDESINTRSFDLNTVDGIEDVDAIEVKSSTTVENFSVSCGETEEGTTGASGSTDETEESEESEAEDTESGTDDSGTEAEDTESGTDDSGTETEDTETEDTESGTDDSGTENEDTEQAQSEARDDSDSDSDESNDGDSDEVEDDDEDDDEDS
jgi:hypothetical protein